MFMLWLYRYMTGYVHFKCFGRFPERFLNLCASGGLTIWSSRVVGGVLYGSMRVCDYRKIIGFAKKAGVRTRIIHRRGAVFIARRYRRRYGIPAGAMLFFAILWFLSCFIWSVEVDGNKRADANSILEHCRSVGVYEGAKIGKINAAVAGQRLLMRDTRLSWAAVNIRGCLCTVDVRETLRRRRAVSDAPANVVAARGGIITAIQADFGEIKVLVGEAVAPGDMLISGTVGLKNSVTRFVRARGTVTAQTERVLRVFVPFEQTGSSVSDKADTRRVLSLFSVKIPLFLGGVDKPYLRKRESARLCFFDVKLPIELVRAEFYPITRYKYTLTERQAKLKALQKMNKKAEKELKKILKSEGDGAYSVTKNGVWFSKRFICTENIAKAEKILINQ